MSELRRVMCVEDDPDIRMIIEFSLATLGGYQVCLCPDGRAALTQAPNFKPDLVLLDVMMPGELDGLDLCRAMKSTPKLHGVPVIILSARGGSADREAGLNAGATEYLVKPFSPMQLLVLLGDIVAKPQSGRS